MSKRLFTMCLLVLFASTLIIAQDRPLGKTKVLADDSVVPTVTTTDKMGSGLNLTGESIGVTTDYDYFSNSIVRDQIVWDATLTTPHLLNMVRGFDTGNPTVRYVMHSYKDAGSWINNKVIDAQSGWPHVDLGLTGDGAGLVAGVFHTPSRYFIWDFGTTYNATQFDGSTDPSIQLSGNTIWLAASGNRLLFTFYKAVDFASPVLWDTISSFHPSPIWWIENGGVEVGMSKSQNEQNLLMFGTNTGIAGGGNHVYNGIPEAEADNFWVISSTDAGATWTGEMIAPDGVINGVSGYHTPQFAPLIENFGQVDMAVTNDGVKHALANGYGLTFNATGDTAIGNSFPVLYWNSTTDTWVSISDKEIDTVAAIADLYPTNSIGQAYPSISVSENGQVLYAMWTGPQFSAPGVLDTLNALYWRDLYHAFSTDGGTTWTYGGVFPGMQTDNSEAFGHAAQHLEFVEPNIYRAHIVYLADLTTGVGPFDGVLTNNPIMYTTFDIVVTDVNDGTLVNTFELEQNYPNPFNPSTQISYTLAERTNVTLKVYDVLGKEIATLINTSQDAGKHNVTFDASNLASGLYIYTINAGNFTSSKKMMLLK